MLAIIDYGGGNLGSLIAALRRRGASFAISDDPGTLEAASAAVLPGDGAFGATMQALQDRGLDRAILRHVHAGKPFLGICVGMQVLFEESDEFGRTTGLGVVSGHVSRFAAAPRVPHMGWNNLERTSQHPFVANLPADSYAYFLHSYRADVGPDTAAACTHGERFCAIVARENVMGTQFHPEKSQRTGALLLDNFLEIAKEVR
jgi:glutamine amidotransferase